MSQYGARPPPPPPGARPPASGKWTTTSQPANMMSSPMQSPGPRNRGYSAANLNQASSSAGGYGYAASPPPSSGGNANQDRQWAMARRARGQARALFFSDIEKKTTLMIEGELRLRLPSGVWKANWVDLRTSGRIYLFETVMGDAGTKPADEPWASIDLHEYDLTLDRRDSRSLSLSSPASGAQFVLSAQSDQECETWCELIDRVKLHLSENLAESPAGDRAGTRDSGGEDDGTHPLLKRRNIAQKPKTKTFLVAIGAKEQDKSHMHPHSVADDMWGEVCGYHEGYLEKLSSKGKWQRRFFACRNGFWNYYASKAKATAHEPMQTIDVSNVTLSQQKNTMIFAFSDGSDLLSRQVRRRGKDGVVEIATWMRILKFRQRASRSFRVLSRYIKPHPEEWDTKRERVKRAMLAYARIVKKHMNAASDKAGINPDGTAKVVMLSPAKPAGSAIQLNGLPQGWSEVTDEATGGLFFWHDETQTAFWAMHEVLDWDKDFHPAQNAVTVPVNSPAAHHAASGGAPSRERTAIRLPPTLDPTVVQQVRALEDENERLVEIMRHASMSFAALVGSAAAGGGSGSGGYLGPMSSTTARGTRASLSDGTWAPPQSQTYGGGDEGDYASPGAWESEQQPPSYDSGRDFPDQPPLSTAAESEYAFDGAKPATAALPAMTPPPPPPPPVVRDSLLTPGMVSQHYGGLAAAFGDWPAGADDGQSSFELTEQDVAAPAAAPSASVLGMMGAGLAAEAESRRHAAPGRSLSIASRDIMEEL